MDHYLKHLDYLFIPHSLTFNETISKYFDEIFQLTVTILPIFLISKIIIYFSSFLLFVFNYSDLKGQHNKYILHQLIFIQFSYSRLDHNLFFYLNYHKKMFLKYKNFLYLAIDNSKLCQFLIYYFILWNCIFNNWNTLKSLTLKMEIILHNDLFLNHNHKKMHFFFENDHVNQ